MPTPSQSWLPTSPGHRQSAGLCHPPLLLEVPNPAPQPFQGPQPLRLPKNRARCLGPWGPDGKGVADRRFWRVPRRFTEHRVQPNGGMEKRSHQKGAVLGESKNCQNPSRKKQKHEQTSNPERNRQGCQRINSEEGEGQMRPSRLGGASALGVPRPPAAPGEDRGRQGELRRRILHFFKKERERVHAWGGRRERES